MKFMINRFIEFYVKNILRRNIRIYLTLELNLFFYTRGFFLYHISNLLNSAGYFL